MELGNDVVSHKSNLGWPADEFVFSGVWLGSDKRKDRGAVRWSDGYPAFTGLKARIIDQTESKLVQVESQASILISNENFNRVKTEVGVLPIQPKS
jgi:subtilase family serine protease